MVARLSVLGLILVLALPTFGDDAPTISGDLAKLQGIWETKAGPGKNQLLQMTIEKTDLTLRYTVPGRVEPIILNGQIKLDETSKPKAMDWLKMHIAKQELPAVYSIYELKGDTLRVRGSGETQRPTEFQDDDDIPRHRSLSFQRVKSAAP